MHYSTYLVCNNHINDVKDFLSQFLEETNGRYNHPGWITFTIPNSAFTINLMTGKNMPLTQNMTLELSCESKEELEQYAKKYDQKIHDFTATETDKNYRFYYIELPGPHNICKVDISYCEEIE